MLFLNVTLFLSGAKLGLVTVQPDDERLLTTLLDLMEGAGVDWTIFWRQLSHLPLKENAATKEGAEVIQRIVSMFGASFGNRFVEWMQSYAARVKLPDEFESDAERHEAMRLANPKFVFRNYLAQNAIGAAEKGDFSEVNKLLEILRLPFDEQPEHEAYAAPPPEWAKHIVCSCSS